MLELHNAKERDMDDWNDLFKQADPRFRLENVKKPRGSRLAILEVVWERDVGNEWDASAETNTTA